MPMSVMIAQFEEGMMVGMMVWDVDEETAIGLPGGERSEKRLLLKSFFAGER